MRCNGKCYLMQQMKKNTVTTTDNTTTIPVTEAFIPLYFQECTLNTIDHTLSYIANTHLYYYTETHSIEFLDRIDHPPQYVSTSSSIG